MVIVDLSPTVTVLLVLGPLPLWTLSVGVYVALPMTVPELDGMNDTEQVEVVALTLARVQGVPVKDPDAVPALVNATVPPGADAVPVDVSFTSAVQLTVCPTNTEDGEHITAVLVVLRPTVTVLLVPVPPL